MWSSILCCGLISGVVSALPSSFNDYAVKERHNVLRSWTLETSTFSKTEPINLQIGLKPARAGAIERHLIEVSDPSHPRYGQHLSAEQVHALATPPQDSLNAVHAWLAEHDITDLLHNPAQDWITVRIPIEKAERLLQTTYSKFKHVTEGDTLIRAPEWSLPAHLHHHIDVVQPTTSFFRIKPQVSHIVTDTKTWSSTWWENTGKYKFAASAPGTAPKTVGQVCNDSFVTPECLRTVYGTIDYQPKSNGKSRIGVCNYLNETAYRKDAATFLKQFRPEAEAYADKFDIVKINGGPDNQGPYTPEQIDKGTNQEGNLDAQTVLGIAYPLPFTAYNTGGQPPFTPDVYSPNNTNEPYLDFINYVLAQKDLPQVIGTCCGDDEQTVPESYAKKICSGFAQLGARGISVIFSSGDHGVGNDAQCISNKPGEENEKTFLPAFPASCPWVTTVGATQGFEPEVAVSRFGSGAGFSNHFPQPDYQKNTIPQYVQGLKGQYDGLYNKNGRAYPDVAAQGDSDVIVYADSVTTIGGTSASSPTISAIIALVNDALIAEGKPPLGFLNPWLYSEAYKTFTDITQGSSIGCDGKGFPAGKGWDAVTGFGTPNFKKLLEAARRRTGGGVPMGPGGNPAPSTTTRRPARTTTRATRSGSTAKPTARAYGWSG